MARVVNVTDSVYVTAAAGLTYSVLIGANQENDLVIVKISTGETSALGAAPASWTQLGTQNASQGCRSAWYYRVAPAGGFTGPVTFTVPNGHTMASCLVVRGEKLTAGAPTLKWQRYDWGNSTNIASAASTSVTASSEAANAMIAPPDNALLIYSFASDGGPFLRSTQNELMALSFIDGQSSGVSQAIGYRQHSTGTLPVVNFYASLATEGGNMWVISIEDDGTGILDRQWLSGGDEFFYAGDYGEALFPFGTNTNAATTIDDAQASPPATPTLGGYDLSSTAATYQSGAVAVANSANGTATRFRTTLATTPTVWQGLVQTLNANKNMENKIFAMHYIATVSSSTPFGSDGMAVAFADAEGDWTAYRLATKAALAADAERVCFISLGYGTELGNGIAGAMNWADIDKIGYMIQRTSNDTGILDLTIKNLMLLGTATITGGYSDIPATFQWSVTPASSWGVYDTQRLQGSAQSMVNWPLQIGDGTAKTYFKATASAYTTPGKYSVASGTSQQDWNVPAGKAGITVYAADGDTMDFSGALLSNSVLQPFTIHASSSLHASTIYSFVGATFSGFTIADNAGLSGTNAWASVSMLSGGKHVFANGADLTNCTIKPATVITDAACSFTANGSVLDGCTIDVTGTDATYHLELGTAVTAITLTDVTFTGTPGTKKIHVLKNSGTVTITISGTTNIDSDPSVDVTTAGATVVIAAPNPTLSATVLSGSRVVLYNDTTAAELDNTAPAGTSWSKVITSGASSGDTLTLHVFKEGYEEFSTSFIYAGIDNTLLVTQAVHAAIASLRTELSITDYTTITEFTLDITGTVEIDADDADGNTMKARLAIWYNGVLTTENGARYLRGAISVLSTAAIRINVSVLDLLVANVSVTYGLNFTDTDRRLYRSDGTAIYAAASAPGSIQNDYSGVPDTVTTSDQSLNLATAEQAIDNKLSSISSGVWAYVVTGSTTAVQMMRGFAAVLLGKVSGAGTTTEVFRDPADTKDVLVFTVDRDGNRTAVTRDLT